MNSMIIQLHSGISASGFTIEIPKQFKERFDYGYNVSYDRKFADNKKPYVSDLIFNLMKQYKIEPEDVTVVTGNNTFKGTAVSTDRVADFENSYLTEVFERFNKNI